MKTKKGSPAKRARSLKSSGKHIGRSRPLHKRVMLHPISGFVLLCVGVLVAGSTFPGLAATYNVTAKVSAPALTEPAAITQPTDQKHVSEPTQNVIGNCPDDSYVKLYRGGTFSGSDICNGGGKFHIQTSLSIGANELRVRVFNLTDDEGPGSSPITVYYDLPVAVTPPVAAPTSLQVSNLDKQGYDKEEVQDLSARPTVSGLAPPFSDVTVTFYSDPSVCRTKADSRGVWSCTLSYSLPPGIHHVAVEATAPSGKKFTLPIFQIRVAEYIQPFVITSEYNYKAYGEGQSVKWKLGLSGGTPPYQIFIDWGDDQKAQMVQQDGSEFMISHTYGSSVTSDQNYSVLLTAIDARGASTTLQLSAAVKGGAVLLSNESGFLPSLVSFVRHWLWVVWPAYIAVVLMVISFWIGEKEAYQKFMARRRLGRPRPHARGR